MIDDNDKAIAIEAEAQIKTASTAGVSGLCAAVMTPDQYAPTALPTVGQDNNRATAVGIVEALKRFPMRLPSYPTDSVPDATAAGPGAVIFVTNGAAGAACLAFSDGVDWRRCDTLAIVG